MAKYRFFVGRKDSEPVECTAEVPNADALTSFKGGTILVRTPNGDYEVEVPSARDLVEKQLRILLQGGVRDSIFPSDAKPKTSTKRTGFVD